MWSTCDCFIDIIKSLFLSRNLHLNVVCRQKMECIGREIQGDWLLSVNTAVVLKVVTAIHSWTYFRLINNLYIAFAAKNLSILPADETLINTSMSSVEEFIKKISISYRFCQQSIKLQFKWIIAEHLFLKRAISEKNKLWIKKITVSKWQWKIKRGRCRASVSWKNAFLIKVKGSWHPFG